MASFLKLTCRGFYENINNYINFLAGGLIFAQSIDSSQVKQKLQEQNQIKTQEQERNNIQNQIGPKDNSQGNVKVERKRKMFLLIKMAMVFAIQDKVE